MKKKLLLTFVGTYLASLGLMVAGDDLVKGYDFTGSSSVTAAKLNQLVDNATPGTNRGLVYYSPSAPSASYYRYLWLDPSTAIPGLKVYSTNGGGWSNIIASVSFSQNSIAAGVLQQNAVSTTNIVDNGISSSKIAAGAVTSSKLGLQSVDATNIVNNTITSTQIATNGLATVNYADASVTAAKLAAGSVGASNLQSGFLFYGTNIAAGTITSSNIAAGTITSSNIASGGVVLTNITTAAATTYSSLIYNGSSLAYDHPIVKYETNAALTTSGNGVWTNLAGAGTFTHNLGGVPHLVRVVLVNKTNTAGGGYSVGDEISIEGIGGASNPAYRAPYTVYADSTKVDLYWYRNDNYTYINKGRTANISCDGAGLEADWNFKIIAIRFKY